MALVRLNKYLKDQNICSRRKADEFISMGYVLVNNIIITELGTMIDPEVDRVTVSNNLHKVINSFRYILLNKPINYVCSKNRNEGKLIFDLLPQIKDLTYAGRLDKDSHGLIILSNDGRFVYKVAGSEFEVEKEYLVRVDKPITSQFILRHTNSSIRLDGKLLKPAKIHIINQFVYKITLTEGVKFLSC